jgi:hypothetical protein
MDAAFALGSQQAKQNLLVAIESHAPADAWLGTTSSVVRQCNLSRAAGLRIGSQS